MVYQLAIIFIIPIILGIVIVSPFDSEPEEIPEEIPEETPTEPEPGINPLYIILGIIWLLFLIRVLRQIAKGTFRVRTKPSW